MAEQVDLASDDFSKAPWDYPGSHPPYSGLLHEGRYLQLGPKRHRRLGQFSIEFRENGRRDSLNYALLMSNVAAVDNRQLVVAVGSNASPAVMQRKFDKEGVDTTVPFVTATVVGLAVGHSAHVSPLGYIAATPILNPSASTNVVASLLDDEQLDCLDRTEPNYDRRLIRSESCRLELDGGKDPGEHPDMFLLYVSKHGALAPPGDDSLRQGNQKDLYDHLRRDCPPFADLVRTDDYKTAMTKFAADKSHREKAAKAFKQAGWVAESGFERHQDGKASARYGSIASTWPGAASGADAFVCLPSADNRQRDGEQCITLHPDDARELEADTHLGIQAGCGPRLPLVPARLVLNDSQAIGSAGVDQVLRNAMGVEVQETVTIRPAWVRKTTITNILLSRPHYYCMVRVDCVKNLGQFLGRLITQRLLLFGGR